MRIKTLNAWRGIFAIVIVLYHSHVHITDQAVSLGVSFFFIVSGFLLTLHHSAENLVSPKQWWAFWWKRTQRIYPVHWLALTCIAYFFFVVKHKPFEPSSFFAQVALVQGWIPKREVFFGYNGVSWFLGALLFCYACFPFINYLFSRLRLRWQVILVTAIFVFLAWWLQQLTAQQRVYTYVCPAIRLGDFIIGIVAGNLYRLMAKTQFTYSRAKATLIELAAVLFALEVIFINRTTELVTIWDNYLLWWIPAMFIVLSAAMLNGQEGWLGQVLKSKPFQWLGDMSLEIYIFQGVAALMVNYYLAPLFGHFGIMIYDQNVWFQVPLLLVISWMVFKVRNHKIHASL